MVSRYYCILIVCTAVENDSRDFSSIYGEKIEQEFDVQKTKIVYVARAFTVEFPMLYCTLAPEVVCGYQIANAV